MKRKPKTITPLLFVQSAILLVGQSIVSLGRWAGLLGLLGYCSVAKQSLGERVSPCAVALLPQTLGLVLAERIRARAAALPQGLRAFQRVLIQDSTLIALCAALAKVFPGSRNQCGTTHGQLRIQARYDLLTQRFLSFGLSGFTRHDQAAAYDVLPALQPGDLVRRDWGCFIVETFARIALAKAFFLSRLRLDIVLFDLKRQRPLPRLKALRRKGQLDGPVLVGDFFLQLCLEAWQIRITEALLFQLEYPGRYERRARKHFVQKLMN